MSLTVFWVTLPPGPGPHIQPSLPPDSDLQPSKKFQPAQHPPS